MDLDINHYIEFRTKRDGRKRPFIKGTRVEVSYIVTDSERHGMDADDIARGYPHVPLAAIHAALAFYHANRDEVRQMMREDSQAAGKQQSIVTGTTTQGSQDAASPVSP